MYQSSSLGSRGGKHTSSQVPGAERGKEREASPARGGWGIVNKAWIWATRERAGWGWTGSAEAETRLVSRALRGTDDMWDEHSISGASGIPRGTWDVSRRRAVDWTTAHASALTCPLVHGRSGRGPPGRGVGVDAA